LKTLKLILDPEDESEISLGLLRLTKSVPDYEFFFHLNTANPFTFRRIDDFKITGNYFEYFFPRFEAYSRDKKTCIHIISNKSSRSIQKNKITELFCDETENRFLLSLYEDVDYIIKTSDTIHDFSLILLPENFAFQIQQFSLSLEDELHPIFQYYE